MSRELRHEMSSTATLHTSKSRNPRQVAKVTSNADIDYSLQLLIWPTVEVEFYISGPGLVVKDIENEYVTSSIIQQFPQRLLAFDDFSTTSIIHFNRCRTGTQKPVSYPL